MDHIGVIHVNYESTQMRNEPCMSYLCVCFFSPLLSFKLAKLHDRKCSQWNPTTPCLFCLDDLKHLEDGIIIPVQFCQIRSSNQDARRSTKGFFSQSSLPKKITNFNCMSHTPVLKAHHKFWIGYPLRDDTIE